LSARPAPAKRSFLASESCSSCGAWLAEDQEWCLECGAARTRIEPAPDWRIGAAIVVVVLALIAVIVALAWP
jgi:RNA polymerase subunit RPABC4/transcription elongation factor Spt4